MKKLLLVLLFVTSFSFAACDDLYPNSKPIIVKNTVELCNSFYVSVFDKQNQRVILVSEHLKHNGVGTAKRVDAFRSDPRVGTLPQPQQYLRTGYDKGHMAPAGDASNDKEMYDTFLMTNMTPQLPTVNRESWRMLEEATRKLFDSSKSDMYIVNIAVYNDNKKMGTIPIPTGYWKIVTIDGKTKYYYCDNIDNSKVKEKSAVDITTLLPK